MTDKNSKVVRKNSTAFSSQACTPTYDTEWIKEDGVYIFIYKYMLYILQRFIESRVTA